MPETKGLKSINKVNVEDRFSDVIKQFELGLEKIQKKKLPLKIPSVFLLETLPITESDFNRARQNLENAQRYLAAEEFGATKFELRMLIGLLRRFIGNHSRIFDQLNLEKRQIDNAAKRKKNCVILSASVAQSH